MMTRVFPTTDEKIERLYSFYSKHRASMETAYSEEGKSIQLDAMRHAHSALAVLDHLRDENVVWLEIPDWLHEENN